MPSPGGAPPNARSLSFASTVPEDVRTAVIEGFSALAASDDGSQALSMGYGWEGLEDADDSLYDPLRELIRDAGAEAGDLL